MSFILTPKNGEDIQINGWHWRPTIALLHEEKLIDLKTYEIMGCQLSYQVNAELALRFADAIERKLESMKQGDRIRYDLTVTDKSRKTLNEKEQNETVEMYSATYEWLVKFRDFCRTSEGFKIG